MVILNLHPTLSQAIKDPLQLMAEWYLIILLTALSKILMEVLTSARPEVESYTIPCANFFYFDSKSRIAKPAAFSQLNAEVRRKIAACFITN